MQQLGDKKVVFCYAEEKPETLVAILKTKGLTFIGRGRLYIGSMREQIHDVYNDEQGLIWVLMRIQGVESAEGFKVLFRRFFGEYTKTGVTNEKRA